MHKAVARDLLRKAGWSEAQIRMALRIVAYDGARSAFAVAGVLSAFAERSEDSGESAIWRAAAEQMVADTTLAEALFALRGF